MNSDNSAIPTTPVRPPKRKLFGSPSYGSSSSSSPMQKKNVTGYLVATGVTQIAKSTKKKYIELKIMIGPESFEVVRIMVDSLTTEETKFYHDNVGKVLHLEGVNYGKYVQFFTDNGRNRKLLDRHLSFKLDMKLTLVEDVTVQMRHPINVKGHLYWLKAADIAANGNDIREALVVDCKKAAIVVSIWGIPMFESLTEGYLYEFMVYYQRCTRA